MKKTLENKRKALIFTGLAIAGLILIALISFLIYRHLHPRKIALAEPFSRYFSGEERICKGEYYDDYFDPEAEALVVYMFDEDIKGGVFSSLLDLNAYRSPDLFSSFRMMKDYVSECAEGFEDDDFPRYFLLGIDPYAAYLQSCSNKELFEKNLQFIYDLSEQHTGCAFHIYFPSDSAAVWNSYDEKEKEEARLSYITLVRYFKDRPNVMMYYVSTQEWILYSDSIRENYDPLAPITSDIYEHLLALDLTSNDLTCMLTWNNVNEQMDRIIEMSEKYEQVKNSYADLSGKNVYFLGDSIFGNYRGGTAVASFFGDMTGAKALNLGEGGMSGVSMADPECPIGCAFNYLLGKEGPERFDRSFSSYGSYGAYRLAASELSGTKGENGIFIIEFGLNDYFSGKPIEDFRDAMEYMVEQIQNVYPESRIIILAPGYVHIYEDGNMCLGDVGLPLPEYREVTRQVAEKYGCDFLSLAEDFGFVQEETPLYLLPDSVHYNEKGRYIIARELARYLNR